MSIGKPELVSLSLDKIGQAEAEEVRKVRSHAQELLGINESELLELRTRVQRNNGIVRVFVHPFYYQYSEKYDPEAKRPEYNLQRIKEIEEALSKILSKPPETTPPVFIFEEKEHIDETRQKMSSQESLANTAYFIPTKAQSSDPSFGDGKGWGFDNWGRLRKMFLDLKVKKVIIGGMYLKVVHGYDLDSDMFGYRRQRRAKGARNMEYDLEKCIRGAVSELSQDKYFNHVFDVEISNLNFPDSRKEISAMENKPTYEDLYHKNKN